MTNPHTSADDGATTETTAPSSAERTASAAGDDDARETAATEASAAAPRSGDELRGDAVARVLARAGARAASTTRFGDRRAQALQDGDADSVGTRDDGLQLDREERAGLRRVDGLSTELEDVTEVEYRQLRLEKVVLIGVYPAGTLEDAENSLHELAALAETAGAVVLDGVLQRRPYPDPATYLGRGKVEGLRDIVRAAGADTVVADTELAPSQRRALEDAVKVKVIDRTAVILDIFSQHAKSREGKAQVELAQLEYLLPRLRGWGESMSRQAGGQVGGGAGMGSRGPGETKIELDRRRIHTRMAKLRRQIAEMKTARDTKRQGRERNQVPAVAIAGYTNAGKSSLLNRITRAGVLVENQLFATLDATVRRTQAKDGRPYTLADTVGFVRNLPHQLVEAFRSTLEEVQHSDLIVHVVDGSHPDPAGQIRTVREVVGEVGGADIPEIIAFNKADLLDEARRLELRGLEPSAVFVSAATGEGVDELLERIESTIPVPQQEVELLLPYSRGDLLSLLHGQGSVLEFEHGERGTRVRARIHADQLGLVDAYRTDGHAPLPEEPPLKRKPKPAGEVEGLPEPSLPKPDER
ncbi:GTPase HflX [Pseudoclavibacter triregionum]|nr:GTPase HflX [Pseudoclavibacter triregionum]